MHRPKLGQGWFDWVQPSPWRIDPRTGKAMIPVRVAPVAEPIGPPAEAPRPAMPPAAMPPARPPASSTPPPPPRTAAALDVGPSQMFTWAKPTPAAAASDGLPMFAWAKTPPAAAPAPAMAGAGNSPGTSLVFPLFIIVLGGFIVSELSGWTNFLGTRKG